MRESKAVLDDIRQLLRRKKVVWSLTYDDGVPQMMLEGKLSQPELWRLVVLIDEHEDSRLREKEQDQLTGDER